MSRTFLINCRPNLLAVTMVVLASAGGNIAEASHPSLEELHDRILESRIRFTHGHLVFSVTEETDENVSTEMDIFQRDFEIYFDENRFSTRVKTYTSETDGRPYLAMWEHKILDAGVLVYKPMEEQFPVSITEHSKSTRLAKDTVFDPRMIGIALSSVAAFDAVGLREAIHLQQQAGSRTSINRDSISGNDAWLVEDVVESGAFTRTLRTWIIPSLGYVVPKRERIYQAKSGEKARFELTSEYSEYDQGQFPNKTIFINEMHGKVARREVVHVKEANFSDMVDPAEFSLQALQLKPGRTVVRFGEKLVWNGESLVDDPRWLTQSNDVPIADSAWPWGRRLLIAVNAILCLALACYIIYQRHQKAQH